MEDYKERVIVEHSELTDKIIALSVFLESGKFDTLDKAQKYLLVAQHVFMIKYSEALSKRITRF